MKVKTCLRYPGGKFYGLKILKPFLEIPHLEYREPFIGGASAFLSKPIVEKNWINDIDKELINFYKIISKKATKDELYEMLNNEVASKKRHAEVLEFSPKNKIERSFKYFYLNRTSFSGIMVRPRWGYKIGSSVTPDRWIDIIEPVSQKLADVRITNYDWEKLLDQKSNYNNDEVLIYLDPPYFEASKNIYNNEFLKKDHTRLAKKLKKCKFSFLLSYNDSEEIRDMYKWANIHETTWTYFMSEERRQTGFELIITN
jgi:DNA adenine methylase